MMLVYTIFTTTDKYTNGRHSCCTYKETTVKHTDSPYILS